MRLRAAFGTGVSLLLTAGAAGPGNAQYVGKVGSAAATEKKTLRATAVYEYTGSMTAPNASRLVPVVVWDGERYQPGGLYLAQPEPLAVAPGTQYVLEQSGVPAGLFNLSSAGQLNGAWVGLGRYAPNAPVPPVHKLSPSKTPPKLVGGSGRGNADTDSAVSDSKGPVLHRKADSDAGTGSTTTGSSSSDGPTLHRRDSDTTDTASPAPDPDRPTLHRKDTDSSTETSSTGTQSSSTTPDPDRPTLHRQNSDSTASAGTTAAPDPDRPTLHRHADTAAAGGTTAPDPDRPHLRYGNTADNDARVQPTELKDFASPGLSPKGAAGGDPSPAGSPPVAIAQTVAVSDTRIDEPHPFRYAWPSPAAEKDAEAALHAMALRALATAAQASFGPAARAAAKENAALAQAAIAAEQSAPAGTSAGKTPSTGTRGKRPPAAAPMADPLAEEQFSAFELSYGSGATYVYSAHTLTPGAGRRYVTIVAQPDFYGKAHLVFSQTTRGDQLTQTPALHLVDAVDADGDHRAELLFELENGAVPTGTRQFALYSVAAGQAAVVYTSAQNAGQ